MILLLAATPLETNILRQKITDPQGSLCGRHEVISGFLCGQKIVLAHGGIGPVTMAIQLMHVLHQYTPESIFLFGCGGCYPGSSLNIGDLALANREIYGDLGVETANGFHSLEDLKLPVDRHIAPAVRQQFGMDPDLVSWAQEYLPAALTGPFVTINCCSGTPELSRILGQRWKGICENMEGAAAAQVCEQFSIPLLELRGISNPTGTRDPARWDLSLGAESAQVAILELLENWPSE